MTMKLDKKELQRRVSIIANDCQGIHSPHEIFYIRSISYSAGRARDAFHRFDFARSVGDTADDQVSAIHEALGHAAALSRFFWPSGLGGRFSKELRKLRTQRAVRLRLAFDLAEDSPLRERHLRDSLEHFDERLDLFLLEHDSGEFFPDAIVDDAEKYRLPTVHVFKLFDPNNLCFVLLDQEHEFKELRHEVERIYGLAEGMDRNGGRLRTAAEQE